jgi:hypothetical protein
MNVDTARKSIATVRSDIKTLIDDAIKVRNFNPLRTLTSADSFLARADEKLEAATKPRQRKTREERKAARAASTGNTKKN